MKNTLKTLLDVKPSFAALGSIDLRLKSQDFVEKLFKKIDCDKQIKKSLAEFMLKNWRHKIVDGKQIWEHAAIKCLQDIIQAKLDCNHFRPLNAMDIADGVWNARAAAIGQQACDTPRIKVFDCRPNEIAKQIEVLVKIHMGIK